MQNILHINTQQHQNKQGIILDQKDGKIIKIGLNWEKTSTDYLLNAIILIASNMYSNGKLK